MVVVVMGMVMGVVVMMRVMGLMGLMGLMEVDDGRGGLGRFSARVWNLKTREARSSGG